MKNAEKSVQGRMQTPNAPQPGPAELEYTPLAELNLADDFLFDVATTDLEACRLIIELATGLEIKELRWQEGQKVVHNLPGRRGIRMDFWAKDVRERIFDVEMQKRKRGNIPKRTRFYQALMDAPLLPAGEESFDGLNPLYIVVICGFDLFGQGKYRYVFENLCRENPALALGDECTKIILNTKGSNEEEVERSLVDFLHYVEKSDAKNVQPGCDERLKKLAEIVQRIKSSEEVEVSYMKAETREREIRQDAKEEGLRLGKEQGLRLGKEQGLRLGKEQGLQLGWEQSRTLTSRLLADNRLDDLRRSLADTQYQNQLLREYAIDSRSKPKAEHF